jgi:hypothetical protein
MLRKSFWTTTEKAEDATKPRFQMEGRHVRNDSIRRKGKHVTLVIFRVTGVTLTCDLYYGIF